MTDYKRLSDVFPDGITGTGIFSAMGGSLPWESVINSSLLDVMYFGNFSGDKIISPLIRRRLNNDQLSDGDKTIIANIIKSMFIRQWSATWEALQAEYNPLNNYDMKESSKDSTVETNTGDQTNSRTVNDDESTTNTKDITETDTGTRSTESSITYGQKIVNDGSNDHNIDTAVFGFNAVSNPANSERTDDLNTIENTQTHSGKDESDNTITDNLNHTTKGSDDIGRKRDLTDVNKRTDNLNRDVSFEHELTRSGNIGVTSSQQLIQSEIELRQFNFFTQVFKDVDSVLALSIY